MAHIFVKNSLSNFKAAKVDVNFPIFVTTDSEGDPIWVLETATTYLTASGTKIRPAYVDKTAAFKNLDEAVAETVSKIASQIDWLPLIEDESSPYVVEMRPLGDEVSIASNIYIDIKEDAPSSGMDLSEVQILLITEGTEFDITDECVIDGDPFYYNVHWEPPNRITKHYKEEN